MKDFPLKELALLYLKNHHGNLTTAEEYVTEFYRVYEAMEKQYLEKQPKTTIPSNLAIPAKKSYWK